MHFKLKLCKISENLHFSYYGLKNYTIESKNYKKNAKQIKFVDEMRSYIPQKIWSDDFILILNLNYFRFIGT